MLNWTMQSHQIAAQALGFHDIPYPQNVATKSTHMCWLTTRCNNLQPGYATCNVTIWGHHQLQQCHSIAAYNQCRSIAAYDQCRSIAAYVTALALPQTILDYLLMMHKLCGSYCASCTAHTSCAMLCRTARPLRLVSHYVMFFEP